MKEKSKPVRIDKKIYEEVKSYCDNNALKISKWIGLILKEKLDEINKKMSKSLQ